MISPNVIFRIKYSTDFIQVLIENVRAGIPSDLIQGIIGCNGNFLPCRISIERFSIDLLRGWKAKPMNNEDEDEQKTDGIEEEFANDFHHPAFK